MYIKVVSGHGVVEGEGSKCVEFTSPKVPWPKSVLESAVKPSVKLPYTLYEAKSGSPFLFQYNSTASARAPPSMSLTATIPCGASGAPSALNCPAVTVIPYQNAYCC